LLVGGADAGAGLLLLVALDAGRLPSPRMSCTALTARVRGGELAVVVLLELVTVPGVAWGFKAPFVGCVTGEGFLAGAPTLVVVVVVVVSLVGGFGFAEERPSGFRGCWCSDGLCGCSAGARDDGLALSIIVAWIVRRRWWWW
jgi:hypothetical protein